MQLRWDEHFSEIVIQAWQAYLQAEGRLSTVTFDPGASESVKQRARYDVLREGGAAAIYAHHFAEIVLRARPAWLPAEINDVDKLRPWLAERCFALRSDFLIADVALLHDVADVVKHAKLRSDHREVSANEAVLVVAKNYGEGPFGEGKMGVEEVRIRAKSGSRALSAILQNVIDAWRRAAGLALPAIGSP